LLSLPREYRLNASDDRTPIQKVIGTKTISTIRVQVNMDAVHDEIQRLNQV